MDKIEKFIIENKSNFNEPRDPEKGWDQLNNKLNAKTTNWTVYWKVAAVIFFASTMVLTVLQLQSDPIQPQVVFNNANTLEGYYTQQISLKKSEYQKLATDTQTAELLADLEKMDVAYFELNESFIEVNDPEVAEAMLENLRLRIVILNEQIEILRNGAGEEQAYHSS